MSALSEPAKLFQGESIASSYARYRPRYPACLYTRIRDYLRQEVSGPPYVRALDVGCGSGQFTFGLADHFQEVVGCDVSQAQLDAVEEQRKKPNVRFVAGSWSEVLPHSPPCELVTSAQAAHFFDLEPFFEAVRRVLVPGGCLALLGYSVPTLVSDDPAKVKEFTEAYSDFMIPEFYEHSVPEKRGFTRNHYRNITLPFDDTERDDSMVIRQEITTSALYGCMGSISCYCAYRRKFPDKEDPLKKFAERLEGILELKNGEDTSIVIERPLFLLLGRKSPSE